MRADYSPAAGWDSVIAVLGRAADALPARAAPAVTISSARPGLPPFGPGTSLAVWCGPQERAELKLTGPANQWVLHALHYLNGPDREFFTGSGWYLNDSRPRIPPDAAGLCDRLLTAHSEARAAGNREAARLAADGTRPRVAAATYQHWDGYRLTLDAGGSAAVYAYTRGCWDFLEGPSGRAGPAPLDPWIDVTGGFLVRDGQTHEALERHVIAALRSREAATALPAKSAGAGQPGRYPPAEPGR